MPEQSLGNRLAQVMQDHALTPAEFARRVDFSQGYISQLLSGQKQRISDRFSAAVARQFNVNDHWLRTGVGDPYKPPSPSVAELGRPWLFSEEALNKWPQLKSLVAAANDLNSPLVRVILSEILKQLKEENEAQRPESKTES